MRIGLDAYSIRFQGWSPSEMVENIYEMGFRKISIDVRTLLDLSSTDLLRLREKLDDVEFEICTSGLALVPSSLIPQLDQQSAIVSHARSLVKCIEVSCLLGSTCLRTFVLESDAWSDVECDYDRYWVLDRAADILSKLERAAEGTGLRLVVENHQDYFSKDLLRLIENTDRDRVGICFDFGNQVAIGESPARAFETLAPRIKMCHVKDIAIKEVTNGYFWRSVPLGKGCLPLKELCTRVLQNTEVEHIFLEISTSRAPTFVNSLTQLSHAGPVGTELWDFVSSQAVWLPEVDGYVCRETASLREVAAQDIRHLNESIAWLKGECLGEGSLGTVIK